MVVVFVARQYLLGNLDWKEWQGIQQWKLTCSQKEKVCMGCFNELWKGYMGEVHEVVEACANWRNETLEKLW